MSLEKHVRKVDFFQSHFGQIDLVKIELVIRRECPFLEVFLSSLVGVKHSALVLACNDNAFLDFVEKLSLDFSLQFQIQERLPDKHNHNVHD